MIIGQPKTIAEFAPLQPQEFEGMQQQISAALTQGAPLETPIQLDLGTICRILSTIGHFAGAIAQAQQTVAAAQPEASPELPPLPVLRPPVEE